MTCHNPQIIYTAGFFDGEGYTSVRRVSGNRLSTGFKYWRCEVEIVNTDRRPLDFISNYFKFGKVTVRPIPKKKGWNVSYRLRVTNKAEIIAFLESIIPYLIVKKQDATDTIKWIKNNSKQKMKKL